MSSKNRNINGERVILFDGTCTLCSHLAQFIQRKNRRNLFKLLLLQSDLGQEILEKYELELVNFNSIVFIENAKIYLKSKAIFRILHHLGGVWKIFLVFRVLPNRTNDFLYDILSKNRYKIFGRQKTCVIIE